MQQAAAPAPQDRFDVRFLLTNDELKEAAAVRKTFANSLFGKTMGRVITGVGTIYFACVPYLRGTTWSDLIAEYPLRAMVVGAMVVLDFWVTIGMPGKNRLNRAVNRLDVERHIMIDDGGVDVTHGENRYQSKWSDFKCFQETANVFVLLTTFERFWTIPKRVLPTGSIESFRSLLQRKLRQS